MRPVGSTRVCPYYGYVWEVVDNHPLFPGKREVVQHRLRMAESLGRSLGPGEIVHHDNENKQDNSPGNLVLTTRGGHPLFHPRRHGPETRAKMSRAAKRWANTPGFKAIATERAQRQWAEGRLKPREPGTYRHSEATRAKMSASARRRTLSTGAPDVP